LQQLSSKLQLQIEWRRNQVLELSSKGHNQTEIARILQIDKSLVSRDMVFLRHQAQENLRTHIQQKLPEEYQRCLTGTNQVLKLSWQIANNDDGRRNGPDHNDNNTNTLITGDDRTRLQALSLINDCYKYIMNLTTNGVVITDAIKFVQRNKEKLAVSSRVENRSEEPKEPNYDEGKNQLEEQEQQEAAEKKQQIKFFEILNPPGLFNSLRILV
jgi:hypothetical protein